MTAEQYHSMTVQELVRAIQKFSSDNERSNVVENRWLTHALAPAIEMLCEVGNSRLGPENRAAVNAFRAAEIERELERKRKDIEALERDLKRVRAA